MDASQLKHCTCRATSDNTSTFGSRFQHNFTRPEDTDHLMRNRTTIEQSNLYQVLLCIFDAFTDCLWNLSSFAEANANFALLVTNNDKSAERETTAAFDDFRNSIDIYNFLLELRSFVVHISSHSFTSLY